jgi:hypothetical protein
MTAVPLRGGSDWVGRVSITAVEELPLIQIGSDPDGRSISRPVHHQARIDGSCSVGHYYLFANFDRPFRWAFGLGITDPVVPHMGSFFCIAHFPFMKDAMACLVIALLKEAVFLVGT